MKTILNWIKHPDWYEILFACISIATLPHTSWSLSDLFEGKLTAANDFTWHLTGFMLSIAIDVGMLISARLLAEKSQWQNKAVLIIAFVIAAMGSLYAQLVYILIHGSEFAIPDAVPQYWHTALQPFIDARVIILPLLLPLLATAYALARIFSARKVSTSVSPPLLVTKPVMQQPTLPLLESASVTDIIIPDEKVNWDQLQFFDDVSQQWKGPFSSRDELLRRYTRLQAHRAKYGLPKYADYIQKRNQQ